MFVRHWSLAFYIEDIVLFSLVSCKRALPLEILTLQSSLGRVVKVTVVTLSIHCLSVTSPASSSGNIQIKASFSDMDTLEKIVERAWSYLL